MSGGRRFLRKAGEGGMKWGRRGGAGRIPGERRSVNVLKVRRKAHLEKDRPGMDPTDMAMRLENTRERGILSDEANANYGDINLVRITISGLESASGITQGTKP